jgi:diguanylate cyclase (GGDEF)-like protein
LQQSITELLYIFVSLIICTSALAWLGLAYPLRIASSASLRFAFANIVCLSAIMLTIQRTSLPILWFWQIADLLLLLVFVLFRSGIQRLFRLQSSLRVDLLLLLLGAILLLIKNPGVASEHYFGIVFSVLASWYCAMLTKDALMAIRPQINGLAGTILAIPPALLTIFFSMRLLVLIIAGPDAVALVDLNSEEGQQMLWFFVAQSMLMNIAMFSAALAKLVFRIKHMAERDMLTGIANRRMGLMRLEQAEKLYTRDQLTFCIVLLDLDYFKRINDTFGHPAGDAALKECAIRLSSVLRSSDVLFRYGGEEFLVLLPLTELEGALEVAARLQHALSGAPWQWQDENVQLTASMGVASIRQAGNLTSLIQMADQAMFRAKSAGRNCIMLHEVELPLQVEN